MCLNDRRLHQEHIRGVWIRCVEQQVLRASGHVTSPWSAWRLWPNKFPEDKEDDAHAEFTEDGGGS